MQNGQKQTKGPQLKPDQLLLANFIMYVWDEAMQDVLVSFKDGSPDDTFYDYFNSKFDRDKEFEAFLMKLIDDISVLGEEETKRMNEIREIVVRPKNHNRALAFFKVMRFYMADGRYSKKYGKNAIECLFEHNEGEVAKDLVAFVRNSAQYFHQGLDFEYNDRIVSKFC